MHADQNPWRLLLLRVWTTNIQAQPCGQLCENGTGNDRSH